MVFFGFVTDCRFADAPTNTSLSVYAIMEGVVRVPSEFSITLVLPFSRTATHEFVVPKSMPMIVDLLILISPLY